MSPCAPMVMEFRRRSVDWTGRTFWERRVQPTERRASNSKSAALGKGPSQVWRRADNSHLFIHIPQLSASPHFGQRHPVSGCHGGLKTGPNCEDASKARGKTALGIGRGATPRRAERQRASIANWTSTVRNTPYGGHGTQGMEAGPPHEPRLKLTL